MPRHTPAHISQPSRRTFGRTTCCALPGWSCFAEVSAAQCDGPQNTARHIDRSDVVRVVAAGRLATPALSTDGSAVRQTFIRFLVSTVTRQHRRCVPIERGEPPGTRTRFGQVGGVRPIRVANSPCPRACRDQSARALPMTFPEYGLALRPVTKIATEMRACHVAVA